MTDSPDMKTAVGRLNAAMEVAGIRSAAELAERSGLGGPRVRHYVNGTREVTADAAPKLGRALNVDASWLMYGAGKGPAGLPPLNLPIDETLPPRNFQFAPTPEKPDFQHTIEVKGTAEAGKDGRFYFNGETVDRVARPPRLAHRMTVYCIRLEGDSMVPILDSGELLFVDAAQKPRPGRIAVIQLHPTQDGEPAPAFVKRVERITSEWVDLKEWQPKERVFRIQMSRIKTMHLVLKNSEMY